MNIDLLTKGTTAKRTCPKWYKISCFAFYIARQQWARQVFVGRTHIVSVGRALDIRSRRRTDSDLHKNNFCREDPFGWKTFCRDWCRQLFSSIVSSSHRAPLILKEEFRETAWGSMPNLFASNDGRTQTHKEYTFRPPICRRQFSRCWKAYYWHLFFPPWSVLYCESWHRSLVGDV